MTNQFSPWIEPVRNNLVTFGDSCNKTPRPGPQFTDCTQKIRPGPQFTDCSDRKTPGPYGTWCEYTGPVVPKCKLTDLHLSK